MIELLVAIAVFAMIISGISYLLLDTYVLNRDARERAQALFLSEEGIEAVRSIRDGGWENLPLTEGDYCITFSGEAWSFSASPPPCDPVGIFNRVIQLRNLSSSEREITSYVTWDFGRGATRTVPLTTYLANWR